jgi:hypothetical protein
MSKQPEYKGERNPLASRRLKRELLKDRFVPKKKAEKPEPKPEPAQT